MPPIIVGPISLSSLSLFCFSSLSLLSLFCFSSLSLSPLSPLSPPTCDRATLSSYSASSNVSIVFIMFSWSRARSCQSVWNRRVARSVSSSEGRPTGGRRRGRRGRRRVIPVLACSTTKHTQHTGSIACCSTLLFSSTYPPCPASPPAAAAPNLHPRLQDSLISATSPPRRYRRRPRPRRPGKETVPRPCRGGKGSMTRLVRALPRETENRRRGPHRTVGTRTRKGQGQDDAVSSVKTLHGFLRIVYRHICTTLYW